jgi:transposase
VKKKTQDGRRLRRYERRCIVERFFAWLQWRRRLLVRWEFYAANFLGFVQLAPITILLKRF